MQCSGRFKVGNVSGIESYIVALLAATFTDVFYLVTRSRFANKTQTLELCGTRNLSRTLMTKEGVAALVVAAAKYQKGRGKRAQERSRLFSALRGPAQRIPVSAAFSYSKRDLLL